MHCPPMETNRLTAANLSIGGGPVIIALCEKVGLDYVSASPYHVPIARLAAAQAALRSMK